MAQRIIEMLIGRLITDEQFRSEFIRAPEQMLLHLSDRGFELSKTEVAALMNTDPNVWARTADAIDPRLQKVSLKTKREFHDSKVEKPPPTTRDVRTPRLAKDEGMIVTVDCTSARNLRRSTHVAGSRASHRAAFRV